MNATQWCWISITALFAIAGAIFTQGALDQLDPQPSSPAAGSTRRKKLRLGANPVDVEGVVDTSDKVVHLIVLPNFKEEEAMLAETLHSLSEAEEHEDFCIILAMEEREPESFIKGERLLEMYQDSFAAIVLSVHPVDLKETHQDDSVEPEVPGKAANLKWAVPQGLAELQRQGFLRFPSSVILTVADADCIFHPCYFSSVSREFNMLRENPGDDYRWTMWQAPQLPFRNYYDVPACCRLWGYISSTYEFGGVCSLSFGGTHMVFSGYSLPLQLAIDASPWDGDVIAEDHHAYLKCFFYSARASAENSLALSKSNIYASCAPRLTVRPIYLPVKSTSVSAESYWRTWIERWHQARRHAQGVSELSYAALALYDALCTLPLRLHSVSLYWSVCKIMSRLWCMHLLPIWQAISLGTITAVWFRNGGHLKLCPTDVWWAELTTVQYFICGAGGGWILIWPVLIPTFLVIVANYMFLNVTFLKCKEAGRAGTIWHAEDAGMPCGCCSARCTAICLMIVDCLLLVTALMIPYGFFTGVAAFINVSIFGNRVTYVTASKPATAAPCYYGSMSNRLSANTRWKSRRSQAPGAAQICSPSSSGSDSERSGEADADMLQAAPFRPL